MIKLLIEAWVYAVMVEAWALLIEAWVYALLKSGIILIFFTYDVK
jgi:hypothetical protein